MQRKIRVLRLHYLPLLIVAVLFCGSICALLLHLGQNQAESREAVTPALLGRLIVLDAGHGGIDPGVVGGSGLLEKDVNLAVAKRLCELLRAAGAEVIMSRENDNALASGKSDDLAARVALVEENAAELLLSIHSNSYPQGPSSHGAQVFYWAGNGEGQRLAEQVQAAIVRNLQNTDRQALAHRSAYILKHTTAPAVVIEVGFLSNAEEEALLQDVEYQWQLAWAIYDGLLDYLLAAATTPD